MEKAVRSGPVQFARVICRGGSRSVEDDPERLGGQGELPDLFDEPVTMFRGPPLRSLPLFEEPRVQDVEAVDQPGCDTRRQGCGRCGKRRIAARCRGRCCGSAHVAARIRVPGLRASETGTLDARAPGRCLPWPPNRNRIRPGPLSWPAPPGSRGGTGRRVSMRGCEPRVQGAAGGSAAGGRGRRSKGSWGSPRRSGSWTLARGRDGFGHTPVACRLPPRDGSRGWVFPFSRGDLREIRGWPKHAG